MSTPRTSTRSHRGAHHRTDVRIVGQLPMIIVFTVTELVNSWEFAGKPVYQLWANCIQARGSLGLGGRQRRPRSRGASSRTGPMPGGAAGLRRARGKPSTAATVSTERAAGGGNDEASPLRGAGSVRGRSSALTAQPANVVSGTSAKSGVSEKDSLESIQANSTRDPQGRGLSAGRLPPAGDATPAPPAGGVIDAYHRAVRAPCAQPFPLTGA